VLTISTGAFRSACVGALVAFVLATAAHIVAMHDPALAGAYRWSHAGMVIPVLAYRVLSYTYFVALLVGLGGAFFYWWGARWLLVLSIAISASAAAFGGLVVHSPIETTAVSLYGMLHVWLVVVAFWSPLAHRFTRNANVPAT
jgi:hypothetical protein